MGEVTPIRVGWIGCGVMGRWMSQHCIEIGKHKVFVCSRTKIKCKPLIEIGATFIQTPSLLIKEGVNVIVTMVGFPQELEEIVFGKDGVIEGMKSLPPTAIRPHLIDMSTSRPSLAQRIAKEMRNLSSDALDAPVSGGDIGAREQRLSIMVGGTKTLFEFYENSLLRCMADISKGGKVVYIGDSGTGQHTKLTNQILIATNMIGVCEALLYAYKNELDIKRVLNAVSSGAAGSWSLSNLAPRMLHRDFEPGFCIDHFVKDLEIALDEARSLNLSLPGLALSHQLYVALKANGNGKNGTQALILALERLNSIKIAEDLQM